MHYTLSKFAFIRLAYLCVMYYFQIKHRFLVNTAGVGNLKAFAGVIRISAS